MDFQSVFAHCSVSGIRVKFKSRGIPANLCPPLKSPLKGATGPPALQLGWKEERKGCNLWKHADFLLKISLIGILSSWESLPSAFRHKATAAAGNRSILTQWWGCTIELLTPGGMQGSSQGSAGHDPAPRHTLEWEIDNVSTMALLIKGLTIRLLLPPVILSPAGPVCVLRCGWSLTPVWVQILTFYEIVAISCSHMMGSATLVLRVEP